MSMKPKYWVGKPNATLTCDLCSRPFNGKFADCCTRLGQWGSICMKCHKAEGSPLGTGSGQKYELQEDGKWLKTAG